ncbi:spore coat protein [Alkalihalobacterium bogoriense]|uniref:spore coat protein n=1 Tax=Alkalihalobacterium bogoriense TaxID=246272 RepID=UPI00047B78DC|nr:spore coat protein [Alkalihalobacterium bogoriense]
MNQIMENITGMSALTDQVIATDLLIAAKAEVKNYSVAITETTTPQLRSTLKQHLNDAIEAHEKISTYMISKGYYMPHDMSKQLQMDKTVSNTALQVAQKMQ